MDQEVMDAIQRGDHPFKVVVYKHDRIPPVRIFDGYSTARDAREFANGLRGQSDRNGWNYIIAVEKA